MATATTVRVAIMAMLLLACTAKAQSAAIDCEATLVLTTGGLLCGGLVEAGSGQVAAYLGIPYGENTGGDGRFQPPVPRRPWAGVLRATRTGASCPQVALGEGGGAGMESEDCLVINVWAPFQPASGPRPVLVFVHGGGFLVGNATDALAAADVDWYNLDGRFLAAEHDLVVVSMNYRLGAFGFLAGVADAAGNQGILDQQLALRWVQDNIAVFGGDPGQVTLVGESAGGISVAVHLFGAPDSAPLFQRAIIESNPAGVGIHTMAEAQQQAERLLGNLDCLITFDRRACLLSKTVEEIQAAQAPELDLLNLVAYGSNALLSWMPVVDGVVIARQPLTAALDGSGGKPVIIGNNADEAFSFFNMLATDDLSPIMAEMVLDLLLGTGPARVIQLNYMVGAPDTAAAMLDGVGDYMFMCPAELAATAAEVGYHYRFVHVPQYVGGMTGGDLCHERACHAVELPYVFGTGRFTDGFSMADRAVSDRMMAAWAAFARGEGDAAEGLADWPAAQRTARGVPTLWLDDAWSVTDIPAPRCLAWEGFYRSR